MERPDYETMADGCDGDSDGLAAALGDGYAVVWEAYNSYGYGHHDGNAVFRTVDGRWIHAECGGCSCEGSGSWSYCESESDAMRLVPDGVKAEAAKCEMT